MLLCPMCINYIEVIYMVARGYENSLRMLKYVKLEKRNLVSPSVHVMFYLLYIHQWNTKPFHLNNFFSWKMLVSLSAVFWMSRNAPLKILLRLQGRLAKGAIYYVTIATVIFSHVKIRCYFHLWRYHVFARKLTWYFTGVYTPMSIKVASEKNDAWSTFHSPRCIIISLET